MAILPLSALIATDNIIGGAAGNNQAKLVRSNTGTLYAFVRRNIDSVSIYYSKDNGTTWTYSGAGAAISSSDFDVKVNAAFNSVWYVFNSGTATYIRRGKFNGTDTGIDWDAAATSIPVIGGFIRQLRNPVILPFPTPYTTGRESAHVIYLEINASGNRLGYARFGWKADTGLILQQTGIESTGWDDIPSSHLAAYVQADYRTSGNPDLFVMWNCGISGLAEGQGIRFCKLNYNGGSWQPGPERSVSFQPAHNGIMSGKFNGWDSFYMAWVPANNNSRIQMTQRNANDSLSYAVPEPTWTWGEIRALNIVFDSHTSNLYLLAIGSDGFLRAAELDRQTNIWSAWTILHEGPMLTNQVTVRPETSYWYLDAMIQTGDDNYYVGFKTSNNPPYPPVITWYQNFDGREDSDWYHDFIDPEQDVGDYQTAYEYEFRSGTSVLFTSGKVASGSDKYTLPGGTLTNPRTIQVRARVWDADDAVSDWGPSRTIQLANRPTLTNITPANASTITTTRPYLTWDFNDDQGYYELAFRVRLKSSTGAVLYDSGKVYGMTDAPGFQIPYYLTNNTTYTYELEAWSSADISSGMYTRTFDVVFIPPNIPTVTATAYDDQGRIGIAFTHPAPSGLIPEVTRTEIFRRQQGEEEWVRIYNLSLLQSATVYDYAAASTVATEYLVRAHAISNGTSRDSTVATATLSLRGVWLHPIDDPSMLHRYPWDGHGKSLTQGVESALMNYVGRNYAVAEFGQGQIKSMTASLKLEQVDVDHLTELSQMRTLVCYRDGRGRKLIGLLQMPTIEDDYEGGQVEMTIHATHFVEGV